MARDTIFRIASMTKPIVAVPTLTLVEECKVRLESLVAILMIQRLGFPLATDINCGFWTAAYQAIDD
jgi:hypothetical protein